MSYNFFRDIVLKGLIKIISHYTKEQVADIFTKSLKRDQFEKN